MPRNQGTSRKGKPKKEMRSAGFGKALQRSATKRYVPKSNGSSAHGQGMMGTGAHTIGISEQSEGAKMKSVLEMDNLSDFLIQAQLANKDFVSEREQFLNIDNVAQEYVPTGMPTTGAIIHDEESIRNNNNNNAPHNSSAEFSFYELSVPRRPQWTPGVTTPEELDIMENETFLEWRRGVARKEEEIASLAFAQQQAQGGSYHVHSNASVTPYEKNLHVWRQLWRVLERSSIVLQIVDARNPLFYLSDDLRSYATEELKKPMLILVNKSDYLTSAQRKVWSDYLKQKGYNHLFFSAYEEQKKIDRLASAAKRGETTADVEEEGEGSNAVVSDEEEDEEDANNVTPEAAADHTKLEEEAARTPAQQVSCGSGDDDSLGIKHPLTKEELLDALDAFAKSNGCTPDEKYDNRIQYGLVGFPNVGKSSVINVLMGSSKNIHGVVRVGVAAQPGKTKHFQTLLLPDRSDVMLCDCPGLVFPSFVSSSADMIAAGVYPIAQMRDHWPVVSLICKRVPRDVLNAHYGIHIPEPSDQELREKGLWSGGGKKVYPPPTAEELLGTYCIARSMLAPSSGIPDYQRASRIVVKDYSEGKLLYCHAPPSSDQEDDGMVAIDDEEYQRETLKTAIRNTNNTKKLQKLEHSLEVTAKLEQEEDELLDDFDSFLGDSSDSNKNGDKRGKAHKSIKKWGKKGRKLRNSDPYGCNSEPDDVLNGSSTGSGVIVNAGKYSSGGYTRANYAGARSAVPTKSRYRG